MGFRSGGRERAVEQTVHGGSDGWIRHRASGSAPEQPVPRKMSDEDDEATAAEQSPWLASAPDQSPWLASRVAAQMMEQIQIS